MRGLPRKEAAAALQKYGKVGKRRSGSESNWDELEHAQSCTCSVPVRCSCSSLLAPFPDGTCLFLSASNEAFSLKSSPSVVNASRQLQNLLQMFL